MNRENAIAAALDALDDVSWKGMEAALDAAAPYIKDEPLGYMILFSRSKDAATVEVFSTVLNAIKWITKLQIYELDDFLIVSVAPVNWP